MLSRTRSICLPSTHTAMTRVVPDYSLLGGPCSAGSREIILDCGSDGNELSVIKRLLIEVLALALVEAENQSIVMI